MLTARTVFWYRMGKELSNGYKITFCTNDDIILTTDDNNNKDLNTQEADVSKCTQ